MRQVPPRPRSSEMHSTRAPRTGGSGKIFGVASLDAFGTFGRAELGALGALVDYVVLTQKRSAPPAFRPRSESFRGPPMAIERRPRGANLELTARLSGGREGSLNRDYRPHGYRGGRATA